MKRNRKFSMWHVLLLIFGTFVCPLTFLSGCGKNQTENNRMVQIGILCYSANDTFVSELTECIKENLQDRKDSEVDLSVMVRNADGSQKKQDDQVEELLKLSCDVLLVNLVDRNSPAEIIDMAKGKDVPVIFFNREPVKEDLGQWDRLYYVGADARESGRLQGEIIQEWIQTHPQTDKNQDGKIQYVLLEGEAGHQDAILRTESCIRYLKENGAELEKLKNSIANWNYAQAENRMFQLIGQFHNQTEMVIANNDDMALGAYSAYRKLNYTEGSMPVFFGVDGTEAGLKAVRDQVLAGTVFNDKEKQADVMAELAMALAKKEELTEKYRGNHTFYIPYQKVTIENIGEYLKK